MTESLVVARRIGLIACLLWGVLSAVVVMQVLARTEYAQAAVEARSVAASMDSTWQPRRTPVRATIAAGRITAVIRTLQRYVGDAAGRIGEDDRALVLTGGFARY
ncbi:MAG: hypothetical protein ACT4P7_18495, partial [Gemmatimonadaceae bacterium]